jgi:plasmid maintenance system killer protein
MSSTPSPKQSGPTGKVYTKKIVSRRPGPYKDLEAKLPGNIKEAALEKFKLFKANPDNPLLKTHPLQGDQHAGKYSVWVNNEYRAVYRIEETATERIYVWLWVGIHWIYDKKFA